MLLAKLSDRVHMLQWTLPFAIGILFVAYEIGPGRWIHDIYGASAYFGVDVLLYAAIVPPISFSFLGRFVHWLEQQEKGARHADAAERRLASITSTSADAILSLGVSGRIESWNRGAEILFGFSPDEICGRQLADLLGGGNAAHVESD
jgi:PAS domain-containing protein